MGSAPADQSAPLPNRRLMIGLAVVLMGLLAPLSLPNLAAPRRAVASLTVPIPSPDGLPQTDARDLMPVTPVTARQINAARPFAATVMAPARPFLFGGLPEALVRATDCLAAAAYYEAGDDRAGQRAVAQVVLNRVRHPMFPATVCGTIFQGADRATGCQFTFTCDGAMARRPRPEAWERARAVARAALAGVVDPAVGYATHYHADYVVPYWIGSLDKVARQGAHIFYTWQGRAGTAAAFRNRPLPDEPAIALMAALSPAHQALDPAGSAPPMGDAVAPKLALALPDVAADGWHGGPLRHAPRDDNSILLPVDPQAFPGSYATAALAMCKDRPLCQVLGWRDRTQVPSALPMGGAAREALSFLYVRDASRGAEGVFWNCAETRRPNAAQCLPKGPAIDRLLNRS